MFAVVAKSLVLDVVKIDGDGRDMEINLIEQDITSQLQAVIKGSKI